MAFKTYDELGRILVRMRLVEAAQLEECLRSLPHGPDQPERLLEVLESRQYLTSYQTGRLKKGETEGLVLGDYKLMYRNASGSFARVFRACSVVDGRMVGLKVLRQRWAEDPQMVAQFRREAEVCRKLRHKNIVPIYDVQSDGSHHFLTMEFVEGGNLRDFLKIRKKLSPLEATRCALEMSEGLAYALRQGVTHRDLKLTNVLMGTDGVVKLVDFGLAGNEGDSGGSDADDVQRALEYATLEKGTGAPSNDPRSDLFFLGAICYELLTGTPPYAPTRSREQRRQLSRYTSIRPIRSVDPNVPAPLAEIVERLMKVSPSQRYQRPDDAAADLRRALADLGDSGPAEAAKKAQEPSLPTILCIENRLRQQDILREYLSKRGFRVLLLNDVRRGLSRLKTNPPDCVVLMGESVGDELVGAFQEAVRLGGQGKLVSIAVLAEKQADRLEQLPRSETARVLVQPIKLRDLRREIHLAFRHRRRQAREGNGRAVGGE